jgi:hypothetical protein
MEANMGRFTLHRGMLVVMPFGAPRRTSGSGAIWSARASREAAALSAGLERLGRAPLPEPPERSPHHARRVIAAAIFAEA